MKCLDLSLPSPAANLALDEALLEQAEAGAGGEVLRFWESPQYFVVVGYANRVANEAKLDECRRHGVPVLRRCSGGGAVLQGPGCLNYTLVMAITSDGTHQTITRTNHFVMECHREVVAGLTGRPIEVEGHTDLVRGRLKFSGNAQRRRRQFLLFHGTFLIEFDLSQVERFLQMPARQPEYREGRTHLDFLTNLEVSPDALKERLKQSWRAADSPGALPDYRGLIEEKYGRPEWNLKF